MCDFIVTKGVYKVRSAKQAVGTPSPPSRICVLCGQEVRVLKP